MKIYLDALKNRQDWVNIFEKNPSFTKLLADYHMMNTLEHFEDYLAPIHEHLTITSFQKDWTGKLTISPNPASVKAVCEFLQNPQDSSADIEANEHIQQELQLARASVDVNLEQSVSYVNQALKTLIQAFKAEYEVSVDWLMYVYELFHDDIWGVGHGRFYIERAGHELRFEIQIERECA